MAIILANYVVLLQQLMWRKSRIESRFVRAELCSSKPLWRGRCRRHVRYAREYVRLGNIALRQMAQAQLQNYASALICMANTILLRHLYDRNINENAFVMISGQFFSC
jgi:hypothetical protein